MKSVLALLPVAGLAAGSIFAATLMSTSAVAQACQVDNGGGCLREGMKCSPPQGGKCRTERVGTRELICSCKTPGSGQGDRPDRSDRPRGEPSEPEEPQEQQPE